MELITCVDVSMYRAALTRGKKYELLAYDEAKGKVRVCGDNNKRRWYPRLCFDMKGSDVPMLKSFTIDDPIHDSKKDCVEVTVKLSKGRRRWCIFVTPDWLSAYFSRDLEPKPIDHDGWVIHQTTILGGDVATKSGKHFDVVHAPHILIVPEISEDVIDAALHYLDSQNELRGCTRLLG